MKFLLLFLLASSCVFGQTGKITYKTIYNFGGSAVSEMENVLLFSGGKSIFQKNNTPNLNEKENVQPEKEENIVHINLSVDSDPIGNLYFNNLNTKTFTCRSSVFEDFKLKFYTFQDELAGKMEWQLIDDYKIISEYKCQKAVTEFRGRTYEAWFTTAIPVSFGPWKLCGLPGLTLEVYDTKHEVYFSASKIEIPYPAADKLILMPAKDEQISHKEYVEKQRTIADKTSQALLSRLPKDSKITSTKIEKKGIELEYEWEKE